MFVTPTMPTGAKRITPSGLNLSLMQVRFVANNAIKVITSNRLCAVKDTASQK